MRCLLLCLILLLPLLPATAQSFTNGDLEDSIRYEFDVVPEGWQAVPASDPSCLANFPGVTDTPDLTFLEGPEIGLGIAGSPFSGATFITGLHANAIGVYIFHEGIMQTVSGFAIDSVYTISFQQAVVKQFNCLDGSGSWGIFIDDELKGVVAPTTSNALFTSTSLKWEARSISFTATSSIHKIKFLPFDDDPDLEISETNLNGGLRMGLDSLFIKSTSPCLLSLDLGNDVTLCDGQTLVLSSSVGNVNYSWQNGFSGSALTVTEPGTYWLTITGNGCTGSDTVQVKSFVFPPDFLGSDTSLCIGQTLQLEPTIPSAIFLWQNNSTGAALTVTQSGTYSVTVTSNGCSQTDYVEVEFKEVPIVALGKDTSFCEGQTLLLSGSWPGAAYSWSNGSATAGIEVELSGTYWLTATANGCSSTDTIQVQVVALPALFLGNDTSVCAGSSLLLLPGHTTASLLWSTNSTASALTVTEPGVYWLTATENGCTTTDSISVEFASLPSVSLGPDTILCAGSTYVLNPNIANANFLWQNNSTDSVFTTDQTNLFWVEVTQNGCTTRSQVQVTFVACESELVMPNVFSPNHDGYNDFFVPVVAKGITSMQTSIYNRWGAKVFETDTPGVGWNGETSSSESEMEGTYFWVITYKGVTGAENTIKGWVTILL